VDITLQRQTPRRFAAEQLALTIADNGRGFPAESRAGLGLVGMRERVAALGGEMALASTLDRGARLEVTLPLLIAFER
jgi:signal transduction histidine kinase